MYNWENLRGITYHSSLYAQKNRYVSVEFKFTNGNAFAPAGSNAFSYILYIVERLPVPKQEIAVTRFN